MKYNTYCLVTVLLTVIRVIITWLSETHTPVSTLAWLKIHIYFPVSEDFSGSRGLLSHNYLSMYGRRFVCKYEERWFSKSGSTI